MSTFHKDRIGEYLYRISKGEAAEKPSQITDELHQALLNKSEMLCWVKDDYYRTACISFACVALSDSLSEEEVRNIQKELYEKIEAASSYRPLLDYLSESCSHYTYRL